jgi:hypothetical protein
MRSSSTGSTGWSPVVAMTPRRGRRPSPGRAFPSWHCVNDRQRPLRLGDHHRGRHRPEHRAGSNRPAEGGGGASWPRSGQRRGPGPGASSHHRAFLVEVMGRNCGYMALMAGIAGGAEAVIIPEVETDPDAVATELRDAYARGKLHDLVVVAEGARYNAAALAGYFQEHRGRLGFELRATTLGHVQRGGAPTDFDRLLATQLGAAAVECMASGEHGVLIGRLDGKSLSTPLDEVVNKTRHLDLRLLELARVLAQ